MNKLLSCRYNMDTNRVETRFADGSTLAIDCIAVEDEYCNTPAQRAELDWLLYTYHNRTNSYAYSAFPSSLLLYPSPHAHMASRTGFRLYPSSVSVYSTRGGTSA